MPKQNKTETAIFQITAEWFLDHPPIEEVGGFISQIIEGYRNGFYTRPHALKIIEAYHADDIQQYIYRSSEIMMERMA